MATLLSNGQIKQNDGTVISNPQNGAYYDGQRLLDGQLLAPGQDQPGHQISNEVIAQTNPNNVSYIQGQINASDIQAPASLSLPSASSSSTGGLLSDVSATKNALLETLATQKATIDAKLADAQKIQDNALGQVKDLSTPFRQNLETTQRDSLYINQNFEATQKLTDELDTLLTQGNDLVKQQRGVTGLSAIRNPRIQQTMSDIAARVGVIQAVMAARNSQISVAENMIDRTANAIQGDRQDQISYWNTVLQLNKSDMLDLSTQDQKIADAQLSVLKDDYSRAADTADYIKKLMVNPDYASLMGEAGVTLNDSVDTINAKLKYAQDTQSVIKQANEITAKGGQLVVSPTGIPRDQLVSFKGPDGTTYYYQMPKSTSSTSATTNVKQQFVSDANTIQPQQTKAGYVGQFPLLVAKYAPLLSLQDIYQLYLQSDTGKKYGMPKENAADIQQIYDTYKGN